MSDLVSIIIPTYNREKEVLACLRSLSSIDYPNFEIIVVDNASEDSTVEIVGNNFPSVRMVTLTENRGAVGGRNAGIKHARGKYFCFVDSDNYFEKNFLAELVKLAESDEKIGFVGPKMRYYKEPKKIWFAGVKINFLTSRTTFIGLNEIDCGQYDTIRETAQIPNVFLVKREVVDEIGIMDETYVMSYGESDWPVRARLAGYKIMFCPSAVVYHDIGVTGGTSDNIMLRGSAFRTYYFARNRAIFMKKFASPLNYFLFLLIFNNLFFLAYALTFTRHRKWDSLGSHFRGYCDGINLAFKTKRL